MPSCERHTTAAEDGDEPTEFLVSAHGLLPYLMRFLNGDSELVVGCGNSELSPLLNDERPIAGRVNMDNDEEIIQQMRQAYPALQWDVADATAMPYSDHAFDSVVDKSLLDFLIYTARDERDISQMLHECCRVTRQGGSCIFLSWCPPREMAVHMAGCDWELQIIKLEAPCNELGQVPVDASIVEVPLGEVAPRVEGQGLRTNFYIYVCTVNDRQAGDMSGDDLAEAGDFSGAIEAFMYQLRTSPSDAKVYESIAQCYMMLDDAAEVSNCVTYALKATLIDEVWAEGHLTLARAHLCCRNFNLAVQSFHRVLELDASMADIVDEDLAVANFQAAEGRRKAGMNSWLSKADMDPITCAPCQS